MPDLASLECLVECAVRPVVESCLASVNKDCGRCEKGLPDLPASRDDASVRDVHMSKVNRQTLFKLRRSN
jgi:hypothetical protein